MRPIAARLADKAGLGSDPSDNASHYILVPMRSRVLRRRSATALGVYLSTALGLLTTIVATRGLGVSDYAKFAAILAATGFFQVLLDLTVEDALVKYGFRYVETEQWGRLRRMFEVALAFKLVGRRAGRDRDRVLAPFAQEVWGVGGVLVPMLIAALLPAGAGARGGRRRRDHPARPLRRARLVLRRLDGLAPRRRSGSACRSALDGAVIGHDPRAGPRDGGDLDRRARRVPPLPAGAAPRRSAATAATCGSS